MLQWGMDTSTDPRTRRMMALLVVAMSEDILSARQEARGGAYMLPWRVISVTEAHPITRWTSARPGYCLLYQVDGEGRYRVATEITATGPLAEADRRGERLMLWSDDRTDWIPVMP